MHSSLPELAHACLDDVDELVDEFVTELDALAPYREQLIPRHDVRSDAQASFEMLLRSIAGIPLPERLARVSESIGRRRAQAGVPLDVLLQAVRLDFRVLWAALRRRVGPEDLGVLVDGAVTVWEAVERHTVGVHVSYLDEAAARASEREQECSRFVAQLLSTNGRDAQVRAQVAAAMGVDAHDDFAVVAGTPANRRALRTATERLQRAGVAAHLQLGERQPLLVARLPQGAASVPGHWLDGVACGIGPIASGLAAVPRSARIAMAVARAAGDEAPGPRRPRQVWGALVAEAMGEVGEALADEMLSDVDRTTAYERQRLVETATGYFATGSVATTAQQRFCHRNTVLNRLRRLGELTDGDLNRPEHAALVLLALQLREGRSPEGAES